MSSSESAVADERARYKGVSSGQHNGPEPDGAYITGFSIDKSGAISRPRAMLPRLPIQARNLHGEIEGTLDKKAAREEAERCLNCGQPGEVNQTCWYCLPCEIECPVDALEVRLPYLVR